MQPIPAYLRPANTLQALEAGSAAGARNPLNATAAINAGADAGSARARLQTSHDESLARNALEAQQMVNQMAMARERNAQQMAEAKMQTEAREKTHQQQAIEQEQRIKTDGAFKEQQLSMQQERLKMAQDEAAAKAKHAADLFSAQQGYANARAAGKSNEEALWENPGLLTPGNIPEARPPIPQFDTISRTTEIEADPGEEPTAEVPAHREGGLFGFFGRDVPAMPASPGRPAAAAQRITRTEKVPRTTGTGTTASKKPSEKAIAYLLENPETADKFDQHFGEGMSQQFLQNEPVEE